jgi:gliding motility-associated-like protein
LKYCYLYIVFIWLATHLGCYGQYFSNPSFEGPPGIATPPPSWEPFDEHATPGTEPLSCDHFTASEGQTYLTLVTRGNGHPYPGTSENVYTLLVHPLEAGHYYLLTVDLASRYDVGHFSWEEGFVAYTAPVRLKVFGFRGESEQGELLAETEKVLHDTWEGYRLYLIPTREYTGLILEVAGTEDTPGWGNLLVDGLGMEEVEDLPLDAGELVIPNVFTPNGDGFNDRLVIRGLRKGSSLLIYDRLGKEVFRSTDYGHDWDGKDKKGNDLPEGAYWYVLSPSHLDKVLKGSLYLKRAL